jgi:hypothetical protein
MNVWSTLFTLKCRVTVNHVRAARHMVKSMNVVTTDFGKVCREKCLLDPC